LARRSDGSHRALQTARVLLLGWSLLLPGRLAGETPSELDVQAHRGGRARRPENTLSAFAWAVALGVDTLEMDLAVTRDRVVVVSHDYRLNPELTRGPNGNYLDADAEIAIKDLDFQELQRYTVGQIRRGSEYWYRFREQVPVPGETIPSLVQVFELIKAPDAGNVRLNLEIKTYPPFPNNTIDYREFTDLVVRLIRDHDLSSRVTIQSFDWRTLERVRERAPEITIACLTVRNFTIDGVRYNLQPGAEGASPWLAGLDYDDFRSLPELVHNFGASVLSPYYREIEERDVREAHRLGLIIIPWTVNDPRTMRKLIAWGVDGLITDVPDILLEIQDQRSDIPSDRGASGG
jgi:glycerophosphoryl diester phosphodiesterase